MNTEVTIVLITAAVSLFGILAYHRLVLWRERNAVFVAAAAKFRAAFDPALAFLDKARRHGSDHDRPDASLFLREAFAAHAEAFNAFAPFIRSKRRSRAYKHAWDEYCELTHNDGVEAVFMASCINDRDPWSVIEERIHAILQFAKT